MHIQISYNYLLSRYMRCVLSYALIHILNFTTKMLIVKGDITFRFWVR